MASVDSFDLQSKKIYDLQSLILQFSTDVEVASTYISIKGRTKKGRNTCKKARSVAGRKFHSKSEIRIVIIIVFLS